MFQKLNVTEYIKEHLKTLSFQDSLRELKNKTKGNFTRLIQQAYNDFKPELDEIFSELKQTDFKYIGLYIQGKLHPCPECGRYCLKKCCSKECGYKHSYFSEFFKETLKTKDFKTALRELHGKIGPNKFTAEVNRLYPEYKSQFDELLQELGAPDTTYISLYIENKLSKCKACGKTVIKPRVYCCSECYGKDFDYSEIIKSKDYRAIGRKISKRLLAKTPEQWEIQQRKSKQTKLEKYNNENFVNTEKSKQTCLERYGVSSYCKTPEFKQKLSKATALKFKNAENFTREYIESNFMPDGYFNVQECSEYFGIDRCTAYRKVKLLGIDFRFRKGRSEAEEKLFNWIPTENKVHNTRSVIYPKELDMFLPDFNLGIEYNGVYWHSLYDPGYHQEKTLMCIEKGIRLFQIFETDNLEIWKSMILNALGKSKKIYARKCTLRHLDPKETTEFLSENHLQGSCGSSIRLGLFYGERLVQVMTFGKPRFSKRFDFELLRFCTLRGHCVIGGASKIFNYFRKNFKGSVISYCNLRYSNGNIYKQLGFTQVSINKPSYFYVKNWQVLSRYQCQKHKLKNLLENFDPNLTETENMQDNGYVKVYDSGSITYILS